MHSSPALAHRSRHAVSTLVAIAACLALAGALPPALAAPAAPDKATSQPPGPPPLEPRILIPLTGNKTTFRFQITNRGKDTAIYPPFINNTHFIVTDADGKTIEFSAMAENAERDALPAGETRHWDLDIAGNMKITKKGNYTIAFSVNGVKSNEITLAVDDVEARK